MFNSRSYARPSVAPLMKRASQAEVEIKMVKLKEYPTVRYAYGVAAALLLGGTAFSLATGQAGAQVAQNSPATMAPRPGAPLSFADLAARLQPAVVNISTKQRVAVKNQSDPFAEFFRRFGGEAPQGQGAPGGSGRPGAAVRRRPVRPARSVRALSFRPTAMSSPTTISSRARAARARSTASPSSSATARNIPPASSAEMSPPISRC